MEKREKAGMLTPRGVTGKVEITPRLLAVTGTRGAAIKARTIVGTRPRIGETVIKPRVMEAGATAGTREEIGEIIVKITGTRAIITVGLTPVMVVVATGGIVKEALTTRSHRGKALV